MTFAPNPVSPKSRHARSSATEAYHADKFLKRPESMTASEHLRRPGLGTRGAPYPGRGERRISPGLSGHRPHVWLRPSGRLVQMAAPGAPL
jgi:hypothetical protein